MLPILYTSAHMTTLHTFLYPEHATELGILPQQQPKRKRTNRQMKAEQTSPRYLRKNYLRNMICSRSSNWRGIHLYKIFFTHLRTSRGNNPAPATHPHTSGQINIHMFYQQYYHKEVIKSNQHKF